MQYLRQLALKGGYLFRITSVESKEWIEASREAHFGDYEPMTKIIARCTIDLKRVEKQNVKLTQSKGKTI